MDTTKRYTAQQVDRMCDLYEFTPSVEPGDTEPMFRIRRAALWGGDPDCTHTVVSAPFGGGVKCSKCPGWFCY